MSQPPKYRKQSKPQIKKNNTKETLEPQRTQEHKQQETNHLFKDQPSYDPKVLNMQIR